MYHKESQSVLHCDTEMIMSPEEKKEKVLHTRIPESLDDQIRQQAASLGVSVSNLVRNVLQNAVGLVGDIVADTANIAQTVSGEDKAAAATSAPAAGAREPQVLGWQKAITNINSVCDACNTIIPKGTEAAIAMVEAGAVRVVRCLECLEEVTRDE